MTDATTEPNWLPDPQNYAVDQERQRHLDALYSYGEFAMFVLMWRVQDFEAGLVGRCRRCYLAEGKIAETYGQGARNDCPDCFGTTFEGGYRARIIRPSLWDHDSTEQHHGPRGETYASDARVQTTPDFNLNTDDLAFRADGTRWQLRKTDWDLLRTGFQTPTIDTTMVGWNITSATLMDRSSVVYLIPPTPDNLRDILAVCHNPRFPPDFSPFEEIRGPLTVLSICKDDRVETTDDATTTDTPSTMSVHGRGAIDGSTAGDVASAVVISGAPQFWVVAGYNNGSPITVTTDNGATSAPATTPNDNVSPGDIGVCVAWNGSLWVVGTTNGLLTSSDGITWLRPSSPFDGPL